MQRQATRRVEQLAAEQQAQQVSLAAQQLAQQVVRAVRQRVPELLGLLARLRRQAQLARLRPQLALA
jgi:hypothetical protein